MRHTFWIGAAALLGSLVAGCDDDDGDVSGDPLAVGELAVVEPGGDTICSRGSAYRFFAVGGDPKRVVIDFEGGGACWDDFTCSVADAIFSDSAPAADDVRSWHDAGDGAGIYQLDREDNPVNGWTLLYIPYCTGDIHWGDSTETYADGLTIHHRGYANTSAALEWLYARYPDVEEVFVTGCSAGAYGAIGHTARIAEHYPDARMTTLGDSGAGVITDTFFADSFPRWDALKNLPTHLGGLADKPLSKLDIVDLYIAVANGIPDLRVAQYNSAHDRDQNFFFTAMGGTGEWTPRMRDKLDTIAAGSDTFRYFVAPGPVHCIQPYDIYYSRQSGPRGAQRSYSAWLDHLINGVTMPRNITCEGDACLDDPVCDACVAADSDDGVCRWCTEWNAR